MTAKQVVLPNNVTVTVNGFNVTAGILSIDIVSNYREYIGPHQLPEAGQLVIVSRNKNLDPNYNSSVYFNAPISVYINPTGTGGANPSNIFEGFITDATVRYGRKGEDTLITITATDHIGLLKRHNWTQDFEDVMDKSAGGHNLKEILLAINTYNEIPNFIFHELLEANAGEYPYPFNPEARTIIKKGDNAWDTISKLASSQFYNLVSLPYFGGVGILPYSKYNPEYFYNDYKLAGSGYSDVTTLLYNTKTDADTRFYSEGGGPKGYRSIVVNDGLHKIINQVTFNNSNRSYTGNTIIESTSTKPPYENVVKIGQWSGSAISIDTSFNGVFDVTATYDQLAYDIFEDRSFYDAEIESIEVDGRENWNKVIRDFVEFGTATISIVHYLPGYVNQSISRVYQVIGIEHKIVRDDWNAKLYLKLHDDYKAYARIESSPTLTMSAVTGNTNTNFTGTLGNYSFVGARQVLWSYEGHKPEGAIIPLGWSNRELEYVTATSNVSAVTSNVTTLSKTWNYDADTSKVFLDYFGDNALYGYTADRWDFPGNKHIEAWTQQSDYWWRHSEPAWGATTNNYLIVSAAVPSASFNFTNQSGTVTFNNTSYDNDNNLWNFGNGATSNLTNPIYTYSASGNYSVTLTVDNGVATSSYTRNVSVPFARIPIRMIRLDISGTRDLINNVWTKYLPTSMMHLTSLSTEAPNTALLQQSPYGTTGKMDYTATSGKIILTRDFTSPYIFDPWAASSTSDINYDERVFTGANQNNADRWNNGLEFIAATSTVSGNLRETLDLKMYYIVDPSVSISDRTKVSGLLGWFTSYRNSAGTAPRPAARDLYIPGQTYEKIKVYVSDYDTQDFTVAKGGLPTWYEIGYFEVNISQTEYNNLFFTRNMVPIVTMPPRFP